MRLFQLIALWRQYGPLIDRLVAVLEDLQRIDDGKLVAELEAILAKHGFDLGKLGPFVNG